MDVIAGVGITILKVIHMWLVVSAGRVAGKVDTGNTSVKVRHSPALGVKIAESGFFFAPNFSLLTMWM